MKNISLGFSPCPNDTFIFHALINGLAGSKYKYDYKLFDVEKLNELACESFFDVTKLSFSALGKLTNEYGLLRSGAALGKGCGPLLVKKKNRNVDSLVNSKVAIPGTMTTANLLLNLYTEGNIKTVPMRFDNIFNSLNNNETDYGVIIHEGRFTYQNHNLEIIEDLGQWWEKTTSLPIPLGGIAVKRDLSEEIIIDVEQSIEKSIKVAYNDRVLSKDFIECNAQELSSSVIEDHINLYVNEFSLNIGKTGLKAIMKMFSMAKAVGFFPEYNSNILAL